MHEDAPHDTTTDHIGKRTRVRLVVIRLVRAATGKPPENREGKKPYCPITGGAGSPTCRGCVWR